MQNWKLQVSLQAIAMLGVLASLHAQSPHPQSSTAESLDLAVPAPVLRETRPFDPGIKSDPYRAYAAFTGRGDDHSRLHTDLFVPLVSDRQNLLFSDIRGQFLSGGGAEGNVGLVYRHMVASDYIVGVYGFYDVKRSANENTFHQATLGAEFLTEIWDFRWNGYLPEGGSTQAVGATAVLSNGNLVVQNNEERAYAGTDAEVGLLLCRIPNYFDSELRGFVGAYHFDTNSPTAESIQGPRVRAELRSFDLPFLSLDSRLTLGVQYQHDGVRDSQTSATVGVRMPFGPDRRRHRRMSRIERRMTDVVVRDVDVVTQSTPTPGGQEVAVHAIYDFEIGSVTVLDASTPDLPDAVANATTDSVIIDGGRGNIYLSQPIEVQDGQQLLGGGLQVKGADSGIHATFGSSVNLYGTDDTQAVILTADNSVISGFNIFGGLHGISSDLPGGLDDLVDVLIFSNNVTSAAESGFRFGALDADSIIAHNRATENGGHGFDIEQNEGLFVQNNALGNAENGFDLFDNDGEVSLNRSLRNEGFGFFADDNSGNFDENESYENGLSGFDFLDNTGSIAGNLSADNGLQGYTFARNNGVIENNLAFDNGGFGFDFADNDGTVQGNLAFDNGDVGFDFADNLGLFQENIATGNDGAGFDFIVNSGQFLANEAIDNSGSGFDFDENAVSGTFSSNDAVGNGEFGYDGTNNGSASNNTGADNEDGNDTFP
ncbi:right-handed parallel beta-helix repeat-containing protein [Novipirellula sp.]|uniref:right-handed parallel beta-helix repeat-containing protein n=1 Tax=Novipirellula sp. TaxID=2795430 RepID=UPI003568E445